MSDRYENEDWIDGFEVGYENGLDHGCDDDYDDDYDEFDDEPQGYWDDGGQWTEYIQEDDDEPPMYQTLGGEWVEGEYEGSEHQANDELLDRELAAYWEEQENRPRSRIENFYRRIGRRFL